MKIKYLKEIHLCFITIPRIQYKTTAHTLEKQLLFPIVNRFLNNFKWKTFKIVTNLPANSPSGPKYYAWRNGKKS